MADTALSDGRRTDRNGRTEPTRRLFEFDVERTQNGWHAFRAQLALIVAAFLAYMGVRAVANNSATTAHANAARLLDFERASGIDWEQPIQRAALNHPDLISFFNLIYAWTYWPILIGTFIFTWTRRRDLYRLYRNAIFLSGAAGLAIFLAFPVAPPRFLNGFVDTVDAADRSHLIAQPSFLINKYAALPSFHVGWVTLALVILGFSTSRRVIRLLLLAPAVLMAAAVIVTGNHYLVDVIAGITLSLVALALAFAQRRHAAPHDHERPTSKPMSRSVAGPQQHSVRSNAAKSGSARSLGTVRSLV